MKNVKSIVKKKYSSIAATKKPCACSCSDRNVSKQIGYTDEQLQKVGSADLGLGCGNPTAFSVIRKGDTVLDLGSGGGIDCFLAAEKVGTHGKVIGIDFTQEMVDRARTHAKANGHDNVRFILGDIERLSLESNSVDVIISNCVINLAPDKRKVFSEAHRVLKSGGRMYVSDIVLLVKLSPEQKNDKELIAGCVAGAILKDAYIGLVREAGFTVCVLSDNKDISKQQYEGIPLESLMIEATK
ncbi:MAG: arsenite methyltransferase [Candidatus Kerfeldbacteria bacterium]